MFTSCPECGTVFRINTNELRVAEGYVRCGHCSATFNAVATLTDEPPSTVTLRQLVLATKSEEAQAVATPASTPAPEPVAVPGFPSEPVGPASPPELQAAATYVPLPVSDDTLEFDIPEGSWSHFFDGDVPADAGAAPVAVDPAPPEPEVREYEEKLSEAEIKTETDVGTGIGSDTVDQAGLYRALSLEGGGPSLDDDADWQALLEEAENEEATPDPVYVIDEEAPQNPEEPAPSTTFWEEPTLEKGGVPAPLPADFAGNLPRDTVAPAAPKSLPAEPKPPTVDRPFVWEPPAPPPVARSRHQGAYTAGSVLLALLLGMQVLHQQRDDLATHPTLSEPLQRWYATLGLTLWPAWDLRAYELRNSEAVADRSSSGALDILARITVVGNERVGLPLVRVTLRDRFSKPLGTRVFQPGEYLGKQPRPREPLTPGTLIPVEITLRDPGAVAQGFDVDVCVMHRRDGIICRAEREPFVR